MRLLRERVEFDGVFAANDMSAFGAIHALNRAGLRVPEDVAVIGFDDSVLSATFEPPLTTIRQSSFHIGWESVRALVSAEDSHLPPPRISIPTQLIICASCGCRQASGAQQHTLVGIVEREGQGHLDLDDLLLRSINTYRSIAVLHQTLRELDAARSVQLSLLPRKAPQSEDYDIAGATRPARQVDGDLYGYYVRPSGALALALGDVAGKGMPAALLMSACATALAGTIPAGLAPSLTLADTRKRSCWLPRGRAYGHSGYRSAGFAPAAWWAPTAARWRSRTPARRWHPTTPRPVPSPAWSWTQSASYLVVCCAGAPVCPFLARRMGIERSEVQVTTTRVDDHEVVGSALLDALPARLVRRAVTE